MRRARAGKTLALRDALEPRDVLPREARVDEGADGARDTLVLLDFVTLLHFSAGRVVNLLHAHVLLATTELGRVDGDEQALDATLLGVLHVLPGDLAVAVDVELNEKRLLVECGVDDVVEGA